MAYALPPAPLAPVNDVATLAIADGYAALMFKMTSDKWLVTELQNIA